ncbi:uncharacterized protein DFL_004229 [Arthrobotrys flagrans]|uniref:Uncharacterized protein n=1 Tax=Arthrobotrys flagrans TaxID=97331 RepID=A0A437A473_ARTFL|nr:hypothetical protein DFL_004229 [Arthrobotrys flagrans]
MEDDAQEDINALGLQDLNLQVVYANFRNSGNLDGTRANYLQHQIDKEYDSDLEDAPCSEYDSEDGDTQIRGRLPQTPSYGQNDVGNSRHYRGNRVVLQRTRQSSHGSEIHELRRAHLDPSGQEVLVDSTPVQSEINNQRGRNPTSRSPHYPSYLKEQPMRPQGLRSSRLAPPPNHLEFLGDRLNEEGERFGGMDFARYSSRERDPRDGEPGRGRSPYGSNGDMYGEALAYMRSRSRGAGPTDREHSDPRYQRNHPRRSPPIGDGY